jgi:hypothetical protein
MTEPRSSSVVPWTVCAILFVVLVCLITLDLWGIHVSDKALDYAKFGNWGETFEGVGTTAAVIVALAALLRERAKQSAEDARREAEAETAVFQWLTSKEVRDESDKLIGRVWDLKIQNATLAPIYQWRVGFGEHPKHMCSHVKRPLLPGENVFNVQFLDDSDPSAAPEATLWFKGRSGRLWRRSALGMVEQCLPSDLDCEHRPRMLGRERA